MFQSEGSTRTTSVASHPGVHRRTEPSRGAQPPTWRCPHHACIRTTDSPEVDNDRAADEIGLSPAENPCEWTDHESAPNRSCTVCNLRASVSTVLLAGADRLSGQSGERTSIKKGTHHPVRRTGRRSPLPHSPPFDHPCQSGRATRRDPERSSVSRNRHVPVGVRRLVSPVPRLVDIDTVLVRELEQRVDDVVELTRWGRR